MQTGKEGTRLIINEERQAAWIHFSNGALSYVWRSKEEALDAIIMHFAFRDISIAGLSAFTKKIALSNLPTSGNKITNPLAVILAAISSDDLSKMLFIANPTFEMYDSKSEEKYGWIEDGDGGQLRIVKIRSEGIRDVDQLLANSLIDEAGAGKLKRQILKAGLPAVREVDSIFN